MERFRFRTMGEILYEVMTGLLFYPRTLWRVLLWPAEALAAPQTGRDEGGAGPDLVSPPLFLLISILLAQALDVFLRGEMGDAAQPAGLGPLLFRALAFSLFPLVMAAGTLRRQGSPVDHTTLREPFELQCLCAAPFALSLSVAVILVGSPVEATRLAGAALGLAAVAWYLCVQTRWLHRRLAVGSFQAFRTAAWLFAVALFCCLPPALLILGPPGP
jgi:hypothetical protein